jgi:hypothetical protein
MADAPPPQTAKETLLLELMAQCGQKLRPLELQLVEGQRQVLLDRGIVDADIVSNCTCEELERAGVSFGVAKLLKLVFPSAGGCQRAQATSYTRVGAHAMFAARFAFIACTSTATTHTPCIQPVTHATLAIMLAYCMVRLA